MFDFIVRVYFNFRNESNQSSSDCGEVWHSIYPIPQWCSLSYAWLQYFFHSRWMST